MGKSTGYTSSANPSQTGEKKPHPIWGAIGWIFIILIPFLSYAASQVLIEQNSINHWMSIPKDLIAPGQYPYLYITIILTVAFIFVFFLIFSLVTFFITRISGPSRYGPLDVPPVAYRGKPYKR